MDLEFICHQLNVDSNYIPKKQKPRKSSDIHLEAVKEEVDKLKDVGAIKEAVYLKWLENNVIVKKNNRKWRVCIDITNLNKACPENPFPVLKIDQLVDATFGHPRMSFLDAFQEYH